MNTNNLDYIIYKNSNDPLILYKLRYHDDFHIALHVTYHNMLVPLFHDVFTGH